MAVHDRLPIFRQEVATGITVAVSPAWAGNDAGAGAWPVDFNRTATRAAVVVPGAAAQLGNKMPLDFTVAPADLRDQTVGQGG